MKRIVALISGLASLASVGAQPVDSGALTLADCLRLFEETHPSLAAAQAAVDASAGAVDQARSAWWPQLDASAGYHRWQRRAFLPEGLLPAGMAVPEVIGPLDDWNAGVAARFTLFDFGERRANVRAATADRNAREASAAVVRADLRLAVHRAFYNLAAALEMEAVADRNLQRAEASHRLARARRDSGAVPTADVLRTEAEVASARLEVIRAATQLRIARGRLNTAIGRPADAGVTIATASEPGEATLDPDAALVHALEARPELLVAREQANATEAAARAARSTRSPRVRLDASAGLRDTELWPDTREWQAGVSVDVPLFDGGMRRGRISQAEALARRAASLLAETELRVREEVWSATAEVDRARAALKASEALARSHEESARVIRSRYEAGAALIVDVLDTQAALASSEAGVARARWDLRLAEAVFARAMGREPEA